MKFKTFDVSITTLGPVVSTIEGEGRCGEASSHSEGYTVNTVAENGVEVSPDNRFLRFLHNLSLHSRMVSKKLYESKSEDVFGVMRQRSRCFWFRQGYKHYL